MRRFVPEVPPGYVKLDEAACLLGIARQTVLNQVRAGQRDAIHVTLGRRGGLGVQVHAGEQGQLDTSTATQPPHDA